MSGLCNIRRKETTNKRQLFYLHEAGSQTRSVWINKEVMCLLQSMINHHRGSYIHECSSCCRYRESYMSVHVLLNILNELGKKR